MARLSHSLCFTDPLCGGTDAEAEASYSAAARTLCSSLHVLDNRRVQRDASGLTTEAPDVSSSMTELPAAAAVAARPRRGEQSDGHAAPPKSSAAAASHGPLGSHARGQTAASLPADAVDASAAVPKKAARREKTKGAGDGFAVHEAAGQKQVASRAIVRTVLADTRASEPRREVADDLMADVAASKKRKREGEAGLATAGRLVDPASAGTSAAAVVTFVRPPLRPADAGAGAQKLGAQAALVSFVADIAATSQAVVSGWD